MTYERIPLQEMGEESQAGRGAASEAAAVTPWWRRYCTWRVDKKYLLRFAGSLFVLMMVVQVAFNMGVGRLRFERDNAALVPTDRGVCGAASIPYSGLTRFELLADDIKLRHRVHGSQSMSMIDVDVVPGPEGLEHVLAKWTLLATSARALKSANILHTSDGEMVFDTAKVSHPESTCLRAKCTLMIPDGTHLNSLSLFFPTATHIQLHPDLHAEVHTMALESYTGSIVAAQASSGALRVEHLHIKTVYGNITGSFPLGARSLFEVVNDGSIDVLPYMSTEAKQPVLQTETNSGSISVGEITFPPGTERDNGLVDVAGAHLSQDSDVILAYLPQFRGQILAESGFGGVVIDSAGVQIIQEGFGGWGVRALAAKDIPNSSYPTNDLPGQSLFGDLRVGTVTGTVYLRDSL